jgi:hypothetical protein
MAFVLRGNWLRPMFRLNNGDRREDSLFGIIKEADPNGAFSYIHRTLRDYIASAGRNGHVVTKGQSRYTSLLAMFDEIIYNLDEDLGDELDDDVIMKGVYDAGLGPRVTRIAGNDCASAGAFIRKFHDAIDSAAPFFQVGLQTLANTSFAATYAYKDVAALLARTGAALDTEIANRRVFETAYIMNRIINKGRCIATSLLLNDMHVDRFKAYTAPDGRPFYNQGSVLYTLLTFCYLVARDNIASSSYNEAKWYFFWKIFGSLLGLHRYLLPNTHAEAGALWNDFMADGQLVGWTAQKQQLDNAFDLDAAGVTGGLAFIVSLKGQYYSQRLFWKIPGLPTLWKMSEFMTKNRIF